MDNRYGNKRGSEKMKKVLFATENESKAKRFKKGLLENDIEIITINNIEKKIDVDYSKVLKKYKFDVPKWIAKPTVY